MNREGIGLVELITALSVAAVLSLGIAQTTAIVFKDSTVFKEVLEFDRLIAQVEQRLSGSLSLQSLDKPRPNSKCAKTLGDGVPSSVLTVSPDFSITKLYEFSEADASVTYLSTTGVNSNLHLISVQSMRFTMTGNVPPQNIPASETGASASDRTTVVGNFILSVLTKSGRPLSRAIPLMIQYDRTNSLLVSCGQSAELSLRPTLPTCSPGQYLIQLPVAQSDPTLGSNLDPNIWWCANAT